MLLFILCHQIRFAYTDARECVCVCAEKARSHSLQKNGNMKYINTPQQIK